MVHRGQVLAPILDPANRAVNMPGGEWDQEILGIELAAGTEAAANIVFDQIDIREREPEHRGQGIAIEERHLGGPEHRHPPLHRIPLGEDAARLHRQRRVALHAEPLAPGVFGFAKCRVGVTADGGEGHRPICADLLEQQDLVFTRGSAIRDRPQLFNV